MTVGVWTSLGIAVVDVFLVLALARHIPRFGRDMPWLVALCVYFALRVAERIVRIAHGNTAIGWDVLLEIAVLPVLVLLLVSADQMIRGFRMAHDAAEVRKAEYERARSDYTQVVRHRVMNPLTVIRGSAQTLQSVAALDDATRATLLQAIVDASDELETISLEPERRGVEERELDAVPQDPDRRT